MSATQQPQAVSRYPLEWPAGWARTPPAKRQRGNFSQTKTDYANQTTYKRQVDVTVYAAVQRLQRELDRLGAVSRRGSCRSVTKGDKRMSTQTSIEWTDTTWNPVTGCDKVSPGCAHCYAEAVAARFWHKTEHPILVATAEGETARPRQFGDVQCHPDRLDQPLRWRKPRRVFVNSMSDLFHEDVPDAFIDQVFAVMALAPPHTFQVLTKRPARMLAYLSAEGVASRIADQAQVLYVTRSSGCLDNCKIYPLGPNAEFGHRWFLDPWPLPNVWLGVSCENQHFYDERVPLLLQTPAAVRWVSLEPLLEWVDLNLRGIGIAADHGALDGGIDWVVVGGESGSKARPFRVGWARDVVSECRAAGVPVFVKQLGAQPIVPAWRGSHWAWGGLIRKDREARFVDADPDYRDWRVLLDSRKGNDPREWPEDLRVREWPVGARL